MSGFEDSLFQLVGHQLTAPQREGFRWYSEALLEWNERFNLTAITDSESIEIKHFLDSLTCLTVEGFRPPGRVVDVGSGAGFPGIPIAMLYPPFEMTLIESVGKKVRFCQYVVEQLELKNVTLVNDRAEKLGQAAAYRESFDWGLARAVAIAPVVLEYTLPLIRVGGRVILQKGETGVAEMQQAENALNVLGGEVEQIEHVELPGVAEPRHIITVRKVAATPPKYPRRPGMAAKRPLNNATSY